MKEIIDEENNIQDTTERINTKGTQSNINHRINISRKYYNKRKKKNKISRNARRKNR